MSDTGFRGSYTVTVTPFKADADQSLDEPQLRHFIDWQLDSGVPGLIVLGTTGEFPTLSDAERWRIVEVAVDQVAGRAPLLVGASSPSTRVAVEYARAAEAAGADGLMISPPYYYTPTEDETFRHYGAICDVVSLPIMLYNNPFTTNVDMSADFVVRLAQAFANIRYIKEASMDVARVFDIVERAEGLMNVFAGERITESYLLGAVGYVNPYGNYIPRASSRIWDFLVDGRMDAAKSIQHLIDRMDRIIAEGHPTYGHQCYSKALAAAAGRPVGDVRPPLTRFADLGAEGRRRREALVAIMGELDALMDRLEAKAA